MTWRNASQASNSPSCASSPPPAALSPFSSLYAPTFGAAPDAAEETPILRETAADRAGPFFASPAVSDSPAPAWRDSSPPGTDSSAVRSRRPQSLSHCPSASSQNSAPGYTYSPDFQQALCLEESEENLREWASSLLAAVETGVRRVAEDATESVKEHLGGTVSSEDSQRPESISVKISNPKLAALEVSVQSRLLPHVEASLESLQAFLDSVRTEKQATVAALPLGALSRRLCSAIEVESKRPLRWNAEDANKPGKSGS
ncbi:hypothetical protein TGGT1_222280 [Toxoplasma gondii GT1]|uniref:Uncharacterized protein n=3 Tax=Toxoplasma gondii TaxID=5811 RepID=S7ULA1_TOXGG|nr:hypothetical protein TGGT1_222280 [Toxoplasma gondii GT1]KAF4645646.1 hypothetical protein TGRH88_001320 [Toxoplasma gondii]KFG47750.1 hypothetical protein TGFOU_222280 [Toxoplasma gondii FOU]